MALSDLTGGFNPVESRKTDVQPDQVGVAIVGLAGLLQTRRILVRLALVPFVSQAPLIRSDAKPRSLRPQERESEIRPVPREMPPKLRPVKCNVTSPFAHLSELTGDCASVDRPSGAILASEHLLP